jgi:hypothetical protein
MQSNPSIINSPAIGLSYQRFPNQKRIEIIVWIRQQEGLDKDQIKEIIIDKFHISNEDAEKLYYEAYPDGLDSKEEEIADSLEKILPKEKQSTIINASFASCLNEHVPFLDENDIDNESRNLILNYIKDLLETRKVI